VEVYYQRCFRESVVCIQTGSTGKSEKFPLRNSNLKHILLIEGTGENTMEHWKGKDLKNLSRPSNRNLPMWPVLIYTSGTTGEPKGVLLLTAIWRKTSKEDLPGYEFDGKRAGASPCFPGSFVWHHGRFTRFYHERASIGIMGSVETLIDDLPKIQPTFMITVPRIFNRVYNGVWAKMREEGGLKLKLFEAALAAAKQKRETGKASFKYKILDKIVLQKIRDRFGGCLENAVTGRRP